VVCECEGVDGSDTEHWWWLLPDPLSPDFLPSQWHHEEGMRQPLPFFLRFDGDGCRTIIIIIIMTVITTTIIIIILSSLTS